MSGWRGWESSAECLAEVWNQVPELGERPDQIMPSDWGRLQAAVEVEQSGFAAVRQVWLETLSDVLEVVASSERRDQQAVALTDTHFFRDAAGLEAVALVAERCVRLGGVVAARLLCSGVYEMSRPPERVMRQVLAAVPHQTYLGRVYAV